MDDVILAHNGPYGGMSIPLHRVTSLHRRSQANAPLRRVLSVGGRRDYRRVHCARDAGGGACSGPV